MEITAQGKEEKPHALCVMLLAHFHPIYKAQTHSALKHFLVWKTF
jgi:hypothetical protein